MIAILARRLAERTVEAPTLDDGKKRAAVAIVLHETNVLLMQRAVRESDPWSGHISLPGGGYHADDGSLIRAAIREAREELGLELDRAKHLGQLAPLQPYQSGPFGIEVTPHVFVVEAVPSIVHNDEAAGSFWLPLDRAAAGDLDGKYHYAPRNIDLPCWNYESHVVWGLTWRILADLLSWTRDP